MQHLETVTVGSGGAASITFSAIPADYTDLVLVTSLRTAVSNIGDYGLAAFNASTSNFSIRTLFGDGASVFSNTGPSGNGRVIAQAVGNTATSNTFGNSSVYIANYRSSVAKSFSVDAVRENNATATEMTIAAGLWNDTSAITSITITSFTGSNFLEHSSASLYGVLAGSDGIVSVA